LFSKYRDKGKWDMVKLTHTFPEWSDPEKVKRARLPLPYDDIFEALGFNQEQIDTFNQAADLDNSLSNAA